MSSFMLPHWDARGRNRKESALFATSAVEAVGYCRSGSGELTGTFGALRPQKDGEDCVGSSLDTGSVYPGACNAACAKSYVQCKSHAKQLH